jgi:uncharacterized protein (TIGR03437 family)
MLTVLPLAASGQGIINTYAGFDNIFAFDGQPATGAQMLDPSSVAIDKQGNTYIVVPSQNVVLKVTSGGIISTFAGNGLRRFAGDGGPARTASLSQPSGVAIDNSGNVLIVDHANHRVRKVDQNGIITTIAGSGFGFAGDGGPAVQALLNSPFSVTVAPDGTMYIQDVGNNRIRAVSPSGIITTVAGNGQAGYSGDGGPALQATFRFFSMMALDSAGALYIADEFNNRVRKIGTDGIVNTIAGGGTGGDGGAAVTARLTNPHGVAFDSAGNLFISEEFGCAVRRVDKTGTISTVAGNGVCGFNGETGSAIATNLSLPSGIAFDAAGNLYIADGNNHRVRRLAAGSISTFAGSDVPTGDGGPATSAIVSGPSSVAVDAAGNVYVNDVGENLIRKITPGGIISTFAGNGRTGYSGDGGPATSATLWNPGGMAFDSAGNFYFAGGPNNRIRRVDNRGVITTVAGNGGATASLGDGGPAAQATIPAPSCLAIDRNDNLYFDSSSNVIRKVSGGIINAFAGNGTKGFSGDGGPAINASFAGYIADLALDTAGNLYIADRDNNRVRKVDTKGIITTFAGNGKAATDGDGGPATAASVQSPAGLATDRAGNLYIATSNRIRKVDAGGTITTYSGNNRNGFSGDGGAAASATMAFPSGLAADAAGNLYVADTNNNRVRVILANSGPSILLSQKGLTFTGGAGASSPADQSFTVVNGGQGTLNWSAAATTTSGGTKWLSVAPASGSSAAGQSGGPARVHVDPSGLAAGVYYGQIVVTGAGVSNSPQSITVVLNILTSGAGAAVSIQPGGLIFTGTAGGANPAPQTLTLTSVTASKFSATASFGGPAWFTAQPLSGNLAAGVAAGIQVTPNLGGLAAGVYNGSLTFVFGDGSVQRADLLLVVSAAGTGAPEFRGGLPTAACTPAKLLPLFTSFGTGFTITAGWPASLEVRVVNDCGQAFTSGSVATSFSNGEPQLNLVSLGDGRWSGTWQAQKAAASVTITARAQSTDGTLSGTVQVDGALQQNANPPPAVAPGGVLNAASYQLQGRLAPGSLIAIFGSLLSQDSVSASALPLPVALGQTSVTIAGRKLPVIYAGPGQVNAMIPYGLAIDATHQVVVQRGTTLSLPEPVGVASSQSGIFTKDLTGQGAGIVVKAAADGTQSLVGPDNPVSAGDAIVIYCSGLGDVDPRQVAGVPVPPTPLTTTLEAVTVTVGGKPAQVFFAGLTSGFTGLYQVNAFVPSGITPASDVPLVITQSGRSSPPVTIAVR